MIISELTNEELLDAYRLEYFASLSNSYRSDLFSKLHTAVLALMPVKIEVSPEKPNFEIICKVCGGKSDITLRDSSDSLKDSFEVHITGVVDISCGDWFVDQISCTCGNKITNKEKYKV